VQEILTTFFSTVLLQQVLFIASMINNAIQFNHIVQQILSSLKKLRLFPVVAGVLTLLALGKIKLRLPFHRGLSLSKMHLPDSPPCSPLRTLPFHAIGEDSAGEEEIDYLSSYFLDQKTAVQDMYDQCSNWSYSFLSETSQSVLGSYCSNVSALLFSSRTDYIHKIPTSFAMSGCGWLIPFHLGVLQAFKDAGYLNEHTIYAGTSGGAIGALVGCCDIPTQAALNALIALSKDELFKTDIDKGLKQVLRDLAVNHTNGTQAKDGNISHRSREIMAKCNHRLHITVTKLWPNPTFLPHVVSQFNSADHLLDVIAASCFIPLYSSPLRVMTNIMSHYEKSEAKDSAIMADELNSEADNNATTPSNIPRSSTEGTSSATGEYYVDGGVLAFFPPIGEVKISPFPSKYIRSFAQADITLPAEEYSLRQLMKWVLHPGSEEDLRGLYAKGQQVAKEWIVQHEQYVEEERKKLLDARDITTSHPHIHTQITQTDLKIASITHNSFSTTQQHQTATGGTAKLPSSASNETEKLKLNIPKDAESSTASSPCSPLGNTWAKFSESTEQGLCHLKSSALRLLPSAVRRLVSKK
jgi:predicted acylesterase/phospholipase RssA